MLLLKTLLMKGIVESMLNMNVFMLKPCFRTDSVGVQAVISTCSSPIAWRRYKSDTREFCNEWMDCSG